MHRVEYRSNSVTRSSAKIFPVSLIAPSLRMIGFTGRRGGPDASERAAIG